MSKPTTGAPLTLAQIASIAGVSVPTVSKVLNQRSDVAPATRERVERIIAEQGFVVNKAGRALRKGQPGQIDFVVQSLHSDYAAEILRGVEEALATTDVRVVLASTHDHQQREVQWLRRLSEGATSGAILVPSDMAAAPLQELRRRRIPFVVVDPMGGLGPDELAVSVTNFVGGKAATQYLLGLGHKRIAALLGPQDSPSTRDRLAGYRAALDEAGLAVDSMLVRYGDWHIEKAYQEMKKLLALPNRPSAVFVGSDQQCLGVYKALYEQNVRIPNAMSVVGFDDASYAAGLAPALTTVRQPLMEMGRVATKMLLRLIGGEPLDTVRVELATPLIIRDSCAPPTG